MGAAEAAAARLNELRYLEQQEARIFDLALGEAEGAPFASELEDMRDDHARHERELAALLGIIGAAQADPSHEFMAFVQEQLRLVQGAGSHGELLERLLLAELGGAAAYAELLESGAELPADLPGRLARQRDDELRHVTVIEALAPQRPTAGPGPGVDRAGRVVTTPGTGVGHGPWSDPEGPHQRGGNLIDEEP